MEEYKKLYNLHLKADQISHVLEEEKQALNLSEEDLNLAEDLFSEAKIASELISESDNFNLEFNMMLLDNWDIKLEIFFGHVESIFQKFNPRFIECLIKKYENIMYVQNY